MALFQFQNPFTPNPNFNVPQDNFIQNGIEKGIENGFGKIGDKILNAGTVKLNNFAHNIPELASLGLIIYLSYLGYKTFLRNGVNLEEIFEKIYPSIMIYIVFKLFWKVILKI